MAEEYLTVSAITQYLRYKIIQDPYLKKIYLKGEITNFRPGKKHQYFNLKDEESSINITMFASRYKEVDFKLENGLEVIISGNIELYAKNGTYSLIAHSIQLAGLGELNQRFEQIKKKLTEEGLFQKPKKVFPRYPRKIAVVTSPTGAVIHDIIRTINQRFPMTNVALYPTLVQGPEAAENIAEQIKKVNEKSHEYDLVIVGRGGGSYEDLFCFNEERVVRAAYDLQIPLVTSVGHEPDYTLIDDVADYSAATPTMAAEFIVPDRAEERAMIEQYRARIDHSIQQRLRYYEQNFHNLQNASVFVNTDQIYQKQTFNLEKLRDKLQQYNPINVIATKEQEIQQLKQRLHILNNNLKSSEQELQIQIQKLDVLNPENVLKRGYAYITHNNKAIESSRNLRDGDELELHFNDGKVKVEVRGDYTDE